MYFAHPAALALLALLVLRWMCARGRMEQAVPFPSLAPLLGELPRPSPFKRHLPPIFRTLALVALVLAVADPLWQTIRLKRVREAREIVLVLDMSESMSWSINGDYRATGDERREVVAREAARAFIDSRVMDLPGDGEVEKVLDRIGLIAYSSDAFVRFPPTTDYDLLRQHLAELSTEAPELGKDTAVEKAIFAAIILFVRHHVGWREVHDMENALKAEGDEFYLPASLQGKPDVGKGRVIVVLSDGKVDTANIGVRPRLDRGPIHTFMMGRWKINLFKVIGLARELGIKIYLVCVGTLEEDLQAAIETTGGMCFSAPDFAHANVIKEVYRRISQLERGRIVDEASATDRSAGWLCGLAGVVLLAAAELLGWSRGFRTLP